ncbi:MAG: NAD(P)/FAD-dependent oxidoreductase [Methanomassiliicoccales archaeon]|nr:MAG: NAD(P)/FAD-dependent oxidoreductase [Methanomassiliicoccales archaeon]
MEPDFDVLIVGAGVVGCSCANQLSKYELKVALLEKESDVCAGASKANSGVVHSGIYSQPGSLKARFCVKGNELFPAFSKELGIEFIRMGKLVVARNENEEPELEELIKAGNRNRVPGLEFIDEEKLRKLEPNIQGQKALWVPSAGIVSPYQLTIALAENAKVNGVQIFLNTEVRDISQKNGYFVVKTNRRELRARYVINCAGLYCDAIARMVGIEKFRVYPCRGEYLILDKSLGHLINHMIYPVPEKGSGGLGIHLTPTIEGNILIGPSAEYIPDKEDTASTKKAMNWLLEDARTFLERLPKDAYIQSYAGIRCKLVPEGSNKPGDFLIEEDEKLPGFINLMGIESPGLTAAPVISKEVVDIIQKKEELIPKKELKTWRAKQRFDKLNLDAKEKLISENPNHGHLICRCEKVTKQEIIDALNNPMGVRTLAGIKYRSRAMMGRCQGGFCKPRIIKIMEDVYNPDAEEITLRGEGSFLFIGKTKDLRRHDNKEC